MLLESRTVARVERRSSIFVGSEAFAEALEAEDLGKLGRRRLVILQKRIAGLSASSLEAFVLRVRKMIRLGGPVNVLVASSALSRSLNRRFRGIDKPTDVLSFGSCKSDIPARDGAAGELAISAEIARSNARRFGYPVATEIKILVVHGMLHLAGFDHERDEGEMERKEAQLRRRLKLEPGLIERSSGSHSWNPRSARRKLAKKRRSK